MFLKRDFSKEQCSSLKMSLGSKHVGAILSVLMLKKFVCALVVVLIKRFDTIIALCQHRRTNETEVNESGTGR